jgi:hypothetical protein
MITPAIITPETYAQAVQRTELSGLKNKKHLARLGFYSHEEPRYNDIVEVFADFFVSFYEIYPPDIRGGNSKLWIGVVYVPLYGTRSLYAYTRKTFGKSAVLKSHY